MTVRTRSLLLKVRGSISVAATLLAGLMVSAVAVASPAGGHEAAGAPAGHAGHGAEAAAHGAEHVAGITWFNWPNPADHRIGLAYLLINFLVLAFLLHRLIIRKLVADNATRHDAIKTQVEAARDAMREAESVIAEYKTRTDRLGQESKEILDQARASAEADRQRLFTEAHAEVERFKAQAMALAQREVLTRRQQVEAEVLDRAVARAGELLRARFTDADQGRLVDDYAVEVVNRPQA